MEKVEYRVITKSGNVLHTFESLDDSKTFIDARASKGITKLTIQKVTTIFENVIL